jgi:hypothetical protein
MDHLLAWQEAVQACEKAGLRLLPLDPPVDEAALRAFANGLPPPAGVAFVQHWNPAAPHAWDALLQSAALVNPGVLEDATQAHVLAPLCTALERAQYAALVQGQPEPAFWKSPEQWAYLVQIGPPNERADPAHLLLHLPASPADIAAAEAALRLKLPPGYRHLLLLTNGLGLDATELVYVCGAGPARAEWKPVIFNEWMQCGYQHEIAAEWREFQGIYDYERIRDWENGEQTFLSDETILVPFSETYDAWCFDRTRPNAAGDYPIMFWDHELHQADERYPDFRAWLAEEMEAYIFET